MIQEAAANKIYSIRCSTKPYIFPINQNALILTNRNMKNTLFLLYAKYFYHHKSGCFSVMPLNDFFCET